MQKNDVIKFAQNIFLFIFILIVGDRLIGFGLEKLYFNLKKGQYAQMSYAINKADPEVLILGSSRAVRHYSSKIISDKLNKTTYNVGRDGQFLPYYCGLQEVILKRKKPELIILDVNVWDLAPNQEKYEKLAMFLPYLNEHPELKKYTNEISEWEYLKVYSKTYRYNSTLLVSIYDNLFQNKFIESENGYAPLIRNISQKEFDTYKLKKSVYDAKREKLKIPLDTKAIEYYKHFLDFTAKQDIQTIIIISPTILKEPDTKEKVLLKEIASKYKNVKFLDYSNNSKYNNQYDLFADELHLNDRGSKLFSQDLATVL